MTNSPLPFNPPMVISVHGIRTAARWQKDLADYLGTHSIRHRSHDFGHYSLLRFASDRSRQTKIDEFYSFYSQLLREKDTGIDVFNYRTRPSVIAHSFGTYIVGHAMQKYPDIQFDKVIICGSILPTEFDWSTLFHRDQVNFVRNEYSAKDVWASRVGAFIPDTGPSGVQGFPSLSKVVSQERFEYFKHSDYFRRAHFESHWLPVLRKEPSPFQIRHGRNMSEDLAQFVATLNATAEIDDLCFGSLPGYASSQIPRGLSTVWIEVNPDIYTFLYDRRRGGVCGYINAMPVTDQCFDKIKKGQVRDNQISSSDVRPFLSSERMKIYMMSVAIDPAVRRANQGLVQESLERLINGFLNKLCYYAINHQIRVTDLISVGWTDSGKKLCEMFGMEPQGKDMDGNPIYLLDFRNGPIKSASEVFPTVQKLSNIYKLMAT